VKLYFVRHGQSEANVMGVISNRGTSYALTELGNQQAQALARTLVGAGVTYLYTSPLLRAQQTAAVLAEILGVPFITAEALREFDCGALEGRSDPAGWQIMQKVFETWMRGEAWDSGCDGGESLNNIRQRFVPFVQGLVNDLPSESVVVLVGHGGTLRSTLPFVLKNIDLKFAVEHHLGNAAPVVAETFPAGLICLSWGDTVFPAGE
jgi:broad specificity phosphatase PhoE